MSKLKEVALFTSHSVGFYPDKLKPFTETASLMEMRIEIFPHYIKSQKEADELSKEELQDLYDNLKVGESFRLGNRFYNAEMIPVRRFAVNGKDSPSIYLSHEIFKSMKSGETIEDKGRKFYKNEKDGYIYVYEEAKSSAEIVEVDTSRPWTIEEYDGAEYIEYLDFDVVEPSYNYCEKRNT